MASTVAIIVAGAMLAAYAQPLVIATLALNKAAEMQMSAKAELPDIAASGLHTADTSSSVTSDICRARRASVPPAD